MEYIIENESMKVTVTTWGAQVKSVIRKNGNVEHIWQADPAVWGYHAPILFPYTSRIRNKKMQAKGKEYDAEIHGFAKDSEHALVCQTENSVVLELCDSARTLEVWPYRFRLVSTFVLDGDTLHHTLTVENPGDEQLQFGIGYHPAFAVPFDNDHKPTDYVLRFDDLETPFCMRSGETGTFGEVTYFLGMNIRELEVNDQLFADGSHCMVGLQSRTLGLYEKDTGRGVVCSIKGFPYTLIWSEPGEPKFVCIEPWQTIPCPQVTQWEKRPAAAILSPGESWSTTLSTAFVE